MSCSAPRINRPLEWSANCSDIYIEVHTFKGRGGQFKSHQCGELGLHELKQAFKTVLAQPIVAGTDLFAAIVLLENSFITLRVLREFNGKSGPVGVGG